MSLMSEIRYYNSFFFMPNEKIRFLIFINIQIIYFEISNSTFVTYYKQGKYKKYFAPSFHNFFFH